MGPLIVQILLGIVVLVGLITILMSAKNWHWAQMLLLLGIFLFGITTLLFGLEVVRFHKKFMIAFQDTQKEIESVELQLVALDVGTRDPKIIGDLFGGDVPFDQQTESGMPSYAIWKHRLNVMARSRGRVWRGVQRVGNVDPQSNQVRVALPEGAPGGIEPGAILYAFEMGPPVGADPSQGSQYLGAFRVVDAADRGATLESLHPLDQRTGNRLQDSQAPWSLYESMPGDRHDLFADMSDEQKQTLLPPASVDQYLRHGQQPTPDDDEMHRAAFDEAGNRLGPEGLAQARQDSSIEVRYDRPLRDYAYLFEELQRQKSVVLAKQMALKEDAKQLASAQENAKLLTAHREEEKSALASDLEQIRREVEVIRDVLGKVTTQLSNAQNLLAMKLAENARLVAQLSLQ